MLPRTQSLGSTPNLLRLDSEIQLAVWTVMRNRLDFLTNTLYSITMIPIYLLLDIDDNSFNMYDRKCNKVASTAVLPSNEALARLCAVLIHY